MSDLSEHMANFAANVSQQHQPVTDLVNQRMQRIQELEQMRQERIASHGITVNQDSRMTRRDRIIHQATTRSDRRNYYPGIQRAPIRSRSFEVDSQPRNDTLFRDTFESSRSNLFGSRQTGSSENVYSPLMSRRESDTSLAQRAIGLTGSDSGSDSSIPSSVNVQGEVNFSVGFNVSSSLLGSDSNLNREPRSSSMTRERDSSVNRRRLRTSNITGDSSLMSRLYSSRESRSRDSRRRRTIQGTDRNVVEALEREKIAVEPFSRLSPNIMASSDTDLNKCESPDTNGEDRIDDVEKPTPYYHKPISTYRRKITVNPDECIPVVAYEHDKFIFVHSDGKIFFLDKMHALSRYLKSSYTLPELTINPPKESDSELGIIESIDGDPDNRYDRLRDICDIKKGSENEEEQLPTGDEERYQSRSYYTSPRERPSIENYFSSRTVTPLYDGIDMTVFETDDSNLSPVNNTRNGSIGDQSNFVNGTSSISGTNLLSAQSEAHVNSINTATVNINSNAIGIDDAEAEENTITVVNGRANDNDNLEMNVDDIRVSNYDLDNETEYQNGDMVMTRYDGAVNDMFNVDNQQMIIRETIVEHHLETEEDAFKENINVLENLNDDQLMTHLQMIHESSGVPLDTSHLDQDELEMIQKALAENPSPSPPSSPTTLAPPQPLQEVNYNLPERESVATRPERLGTILESPGRLQLPSLDFSPLDKNNSDNDAFTFSPTTDETRAEEVFANVEQVDNIKHVDVSDKSIQKDDEEQFMYTEVTRAEEVFDNVEQVDNVKHVYAPEDSHEEDDEEQFMYTEEYIQEVPYSFLNSPTSPTKSPVSTTPSPSNSFAITRTISSNIEPLAIEIPENDNANGSRSSTRSSSFRSPIAKSEKGSDNSHGQPSPFEGETVTTVFEEFVSTIPNDMLDHWSPK